eukprot:scaffold4860_cov171-Amphora_coffeaeformis.AAC.9
MKIYSKHFLLSCSIGGFIIGFHSYKNTQWLRYLSERQMIFEALSSRSLMPDTSEMNDSGTNTYGLVRFVSESSDKDQLSLCTRDQVKYGKWVPRQLESPPYVSRNKHLRCYPEEVYKQSFWQTWDWKPFDTTCNLIGWSKDDFCRLMNKSTLSIIGDSLSWEQYSSLLQLLGEKVRQTDQHKSKSENQNHIQSACNTNTRIVFRNDPRLKYISDSIQADFPLVIVLNRGAHYVNDTTLLPDIRANIKELQEWQQTCRRMAMGCHLYWRTTVPGHPRCTVFNETEPVNDLRAMEERIMDLSNYDNVTINYHWHDFARQNDLILRELEGSGLDYNVIDGYHFNILRPDEHRSHDGDCLHNCYPGKMDIYNQLLLHFLRMERSEDDVANLLERYERAKARAEERREEMKAQ